MQSGWVEEATVVIVLEVARVEVLMVYRHCHQFCQRLVWWCGGWAGEEVQST